MDEAKLLPPFQIFFCPYCFILHFNYLYLQGWTHFAFEICYLDHPSCAVEDIWKMVVQKFWLHAVTLISIEDSQMPSAFL
jgi:hypothetical protein